MQAGTGAGAAGEGEEAAARFAGRRDGQGVAVRRLHMQARRQPGEAADAPGAVQAALQLGQLPRRRRAGLAGGAGFAFGQRQHGHAPLAGGRQLLDFATQAGRAEALQVAGQFAQGILARQLATVQQPGQGTAVQAGLAEAAVLLRPAVDRPPVQPQAIAGAGQGHVGQPQLFGEALLAGALAVLVEPLAAEVEQRRAVVGMAADVLVLS